MRILGIACLSGVLLVVVFPRWNLDWLGWVSLVPLFLVLGQVRNWKQALVTGLLFGCVSFAGQLYWIPAVVVNYGGLSGTVALGVFVLGILALAQFPILFTMLGWRLLSSGNLLGWIGIPLLWTGIEWWRARWLFGGFPWCLLGYSQHRRLAVIQIADLAGVYGVTFLIVSVNAAVAAVFVRRATLRQACATVLGILVALAAVCVYGLYSMARLRSETAAPTLRVAIVQPNIEFEGPPEYFERKYYRDLPQAAARAAAQGARLVVFPEAPAPFSFQQDSQLRAALELAAVVNRVAIVMNTPWLVQNGAEPGYRNSALLLDPAGRVRERYDKIHLVPFGEYVPGKRWLWFAEPLVREVSSFVAGDKPVVSQLDQYRWGTLICYEAIFPQLSRQAAERGAGFLVNLTNDAWFGRTAAPEQHLAMAMFRAIETRRWMVRAANSGHSAFISPLGEVRHKTRLMTEDLIVADVTTSTRRTLFARTGEIAGGLALLLAIVFIVALEVSRRRTS
ncbi:MAG: apolipoprotein N-acyltransferase [Acidobacteriota bacterium]